MDDFDLIIYAVCAVVAIIALITIFVPDAWGSEYVQDARLVPPTSSTRYFQPCPGSPTFSRVLVRTRRGGLLGPMHRRHNGDLVWRHRGGVVKFSRRHTIVNHTSRTVLFVAFCE